MFFAPEIVREIAAETHFFGPPHCFRVILWKFWIISCFFTKKFRTLTKKSNFILTLELNNKKKPGYYVHNGIYGIFEFLLFVFFEMY